MSIRDYKKGYLVINGTTNEQVIVEQLNNCDPVCDFLLSTNEYLLLRAVLDELEDNNTVTIVRTYAKD